MPPFQPMVIGPIRGDDGVAVVRAQRRHDGAEEGGHREADVEAEADGDGS
jgi:hypothetical protein